MRCQGCGHEVSAHFRFWNECGAQMPEPRQEEVAAGLQDSPHGVEAISSGANFAGEGNFVGRRRELGELHSALEQAAAGQGRIVMLVGEPGIGKSRTAEEFTASAESKETQVLWGRCHEQPGMPPYWPWIQVLRTYILNRDPEHLRVEVGVGGSAIAEILPEIRECLPDLKPGILPANPEQARFQLFDSITTFLKTISQSAPLVLVLDNLHWADKPSLLMLEYLAQESSDSHLMVIGTYRDVDLSRQHPLSETLGELSRARGFQRIPLRGMTQDEVARFIEASTEIQPPDAFVEIVHSHTEGNPLFVTELVRMLEQEGELSADNMSQGQLLNFRIPEGVREVIGRRLNRLSDSCNQTLTVASAIGREFEFAQLDKLMEDFSEDQLFNYLEEAQAARIIEETSRSVGCYQFTHALIQQTLMDELSTSRRVRLSARILEALEELYAEDLTSHATQLAYHAGEAEPIIGSDKLVRYSLLGGEQSLSTFAHEDALLHFERALAAKDRQPMDSETAQLLFGLGRAQAATFEIHQIQ